MWLLPLCLICLCGACRALKSVGVDTALIADGFEGERVGAGENLIHQEDRVWSSIGQPLAGHIEVGYSLKREFAFGVNFFPYTGVP